MHNFCHCWPKKEIKSSIPPQDEDDAYGTIDNASERKPAVSFRTRTKPEISSDRRSTPVTSNGNVHNTSPSRRSISFGFNFRKNKSKQSAPNRELPKLPKKTFNRGNIPSIDDPGNPTYESIDVENDSISDPLYSKVDENPSSQRYDYPMFRNKQGKKKNQSEEPLYTSASQIYSGGSEDPYSSIVSDAPGPSTSRRNRQGFGDGNSIYDPSYARVKDPGPQNQNSRQTAVDIDQLYAKINRPSMRRIRALQEERSSVEPGPSSVRRPTTVSFSQDQTNESGSGSIISGSSANPSYRYLTVRESVDVVRERLRQRQNQGQDQTDESGNGRIREHYYSTIANEYESVGGGSLNDSIYGAAIPVVNAAERTISPLTLNVTRLSGAFEGTPPRPPTSPIPSRLSTRTQMISPTRLMSTSLTNNPSRVTSEEKSTSNPNLSKPVILNGNFSLNSSMPPIPSFLNSWHSQTAASVLSDHNPFPRGQPRIIPPISATSTSFLSSQRKDNTLESKRSVGTHTPTKDLVNSETQTNPASKIPILNSRLHRQRSQSPVVDSGTQTNGISSDQEQKRSKMNISIRSQSPNPLPTGRDYISPVDLSNQRSWPLENNNEKKPSGSSEN